MPVIHPKTFVEWVKEVRANGLKVGPLEGGSDNPINHALAKNSIGNVSFGFWDHAGNLGHIDLDRATQRHPQAVKREVAPAPPIPDGSRDWD